MEESETLLASIGWDRKCGESGDRLTHMRPRDYKRVIIFEPKGKLRGIPTGREEKGNCPFTRQGLQERCSRGKKKKKAEKKSYSGGE